MMMILMMMILIMMILIMIRTPNSFFNIDYYIFHVLFHTKQF